MKKGKQWQVKVFGVIASLLLLFSLIEPGIASATKKGDHRQRDVTASHAKISTHLEDDFADEKQVTFLVKFKEQADTDKVVQKVKKQAKRLICLHKRQNTYNDLK